MIRSSSLLMLLAGFASCTVMPPVTGSIGTISQAPAKTQPASVQAPTLPDAPVRAGFWLAGDPVQGGLVTGRAPSNAQTVTFNGSNISVNGEGFFLIGFDRDAETGAKLVATLANGERVEQFLSVRPGNWRIEHVNANPTGGAGTTAEFQARRGPELARINAARAIHSDSQGWRQKFIKPVAGRISGLFGAQRIYNGSPGTYHSGMDIAAGPGTEFVAPADGVVTLAAEDEFTLEGHLLMIDHGMGLNSAFLHCSELLVRQGDVVKQGQVIGKVGSSGRASGPHLHWGMKWNSARIDPKLLIPSA